MGAILHIQCRQCGYSCNVQYGEGGQGYKENLEWKKRFMEQRGPADIQVIYNALDGCVGDEERNDDGIPALLRNPNEKRVNRNPSPKVQVSPFPYLCATCKKIFTYKRIKISCKRGKFIEDHTICPSCGDYAMPLLVDLLFKSGTQNDSVPRYIPCPKCRGDLELLGTSFFD